MSLEIWDKEYADAGIVWKGPPLQDSPFEEGSDILELGCGNGKNIPPLLKTASSLTAVDFSKNALEICRQKFQNSGISFVEADIRSLPFSNASFDGVTAIHVLEHLMSDGRFEAAAEIVRVLKPNGTVMIRVFSTQDMRCGKGTEVEENTFLRGNGISYHYFTENELISLFKHLAAVSVETISETKKYGSRSEICALFRKSIL